MKIRTKLLLSVVITVVVALIISLVLFIASYEAQKTVDKVNLTQNIAKQLFDLNTLTYDYILHQEERPKLLWQIKRNEINNLLSSDQSDDLDEQSVIAKVKYNLDLNQSIFSNLSAMAGKSPISENSSLTFTDVSVPVNSELGQRLTSQLLANSQTMITDISQLTGKSLQQRAFIRSLADFLAISLIVVLTLVEGIFSVLIYRSVIGPIEKLKHGMEIIGRGNLSYKVKTKNADEIGQLADFFDSMTSKLKTAYAGLEKKIKELEENRKALLTVLDKLKLSKADLKKDKIKDRAIWASVADGVMVTDQHGNIMMVNKVAEEMFDQDTKKILGKSYQEILSLEDEKGNAVPREKLPMAMALQGKVTAMTYLYLKADKTKLPIVISVAPVILNNKNVGTVSIFHDISKEKEIEKAKTEFVSLASHQLRTPPTTIKWYAEALLVGQFGSLNTKQKEYLEEIYQGNQRMIDVVDALLTVSRIEMGTFSVDLKSSNIIDIMEDVLEELGISIGKKQLHLEKKYPLNFSLRTDPQLVRIIFQNLLSNAVDYSSTKGTITLKIKKKKDGAEIQISDHGCGIPKNVQTKIFTKFFRADNARTIKPDGNGIGLYMIKLILDGLGGNIHFISNPTGTTFIVDLPNKR